MEINKEYSQLMNGIGEAIFIQDASNGLIYDVNESMLYMYGFENKEEVIGSSLELFSNKKGGFTIDKALGYINEALKGNIVLFEWQALRKNGTPFWVEVSLKMTEIANKPRIVAVVRDISDKKKNEKLVERYTEFQTLLSELSVKLISLPSSSINDEINTLIKLIGHRFKSDRSYIFKYSNDHRFMSNTHEWCNKDIQPFKNELQNLKVSDFNWHHKHLLSTGYILISDVDKSTEIDEFERNEFQKEGIKSILIAPFRYKNKIIGFIGIDAVKSKRNWKTFEIEELKAVGNIIGQSLVRQLYENKLFQAKEKAVESDRLKSAFLSNMSHEIRTPMNGIIGFSELLEDESISRDEQTKYLKIIRDSGKQLLSIINDIVDVSKIEAGQINLHYEKINIHELLDNTIAFFTPLAKQKGLDFRYLNEIPQNYLVINTDIVKTKQILTNLISNAIKFTPSGYISFKSVLYNNSIVFSIEDSGIGMDTKTQKYVFDRFRRADDNFALHVSGTGLGLSISKAYAIKLGGNISVKSYKGKGSIFTFHLPSSCLV